eukprot:g43823.t1
MKETIGDGEAREADDELAELEEPEEGFSDPEGFEDDISDEGKDNEWSSFRLLHKGKQHLHTYPVTPSKNLSKSHLSFIWTP